MYVIFCKGKETVIFLGSEHIHGNYDSCTVPVYFTLVHVRRIILKGSATIP
jgi:hypothetical protein